MVVITEETTQSFELTYHGYIDPQVVHELKRGSVSGVVTERQWVELESIGMTGLRAPYRGCGSDISAGAQITVTLEKGLFIGTVELQDKKNK